MLVQLACSLVESDNVMDLTAGNCSIKYSMAGPKVSRLKFTWCKNTLKIHFQPDQKLPALL